MFDEEIKKRFADLAEHKEKFAAAFLQETGLDPTQVVMMDKQDGLNHEIWFRPKTAKELEIDRRSETTIEALRYCAVCPCEACVEKRKRDVFRSSD